MRFTSERRLDDDVLECGFTLGEIPGILWTRASAPAPLILLGHPGGLPKMYLTGRDVGVRLCAHERTSAACSASANAR